MPSRNIEKLYIPEAFYHVYNRGVAKRTIFTDDQDYVVFMNLIKRYMGIQNHKDNYGREFANYSGSLELSSFCLMPNHFHMLIHTSTNPRDMAEFIRRLCASYAVYFNKRHKRVGHLFQGNYKASHITDDSYLLHITRYIHLNPKNYIDWKYSSLGCYIGRTHLSWVMPQRIRDLFKGGAGEYRQFLTDYESNKREIDDLKYELANTPD